MQVSELKKPILELSPLVTFQVLCLWAPTLILAYALPSAVSLALGAAVVLGTLWERVDLRSRQRAAYEASLEHYNAMAKMLTDIFMAKDPDVTDKIDGGSGSNVVQFPGNKPTKH